MHRKLYFPLALEFLFCIVLVSSAMTPTAKNGDSRPVCRCEKKNHRHFGDFLSGLSGLLTHRRHHISPVVVGGRNAKSGQFPFATMLLQSDAKRTVGGPLLCGATLITERHVLTASHCFDNFDPYKVQVAVSELSTKARVGQTRWVKLAKTHEKYGKNHQNDIAILELDQPVTLGKQAKAAWLPPKGSHLHPGSTVRVFGWGYTAFDGDLSSELLTVDLPVVGYDTCKKAYTDYDFDRHTTICAGGKEGQDACGGDSGGGLIKLLHGESVVVGVVSFGKDCALENTPGVYTDVSKYEDWIIKHTRNAGCQPCFVRHGMLT